MRRRSRDVLVIGEEGLLDEVDPGLLQEPEPATEAAPSAGVAPKLPVASDREPAGMPGVEPEAAETGDAEASDFDEIGDESEERRAPAGIDGDQEPELVGEGARDARTTRGPSCARPRPRGATATVGIAAVLVTVTTIALQSGGSGPSPPDPQAERPEGEAPAPRANARRGPERGRRAASDPARGDGDSRAGELSGLPVVASTTPTVTTAPVPPPAPAPTPPPTPTSGPAQGASRAMVQREFGP